MTDREYHLLSQLLRLLDDSGAVLHLDRLEALWSKNERAEQRTLASTRIANGNDECVVLDESFELFNLDEHRLQYIDYIAQCKVLHLDFIAIQGIEIELLLPLLRPRALGRLPLHCLLLLPLLVILGLKVLDFPFVLLLQFLDVLLDDAFLLAIKGRQLLHDFLADFQDS